MPWTDPRTWSVGEVVTAAQLNTHVRDNLNSTYHQLAYKTADQAVTSSAAKVNDNHLLFTVGASQTWLATAYVLYDAVTAADLRFGWNFPSGRGNGVSSHWSAAGTIDLQTADSGAAATTVEIGVASGNGAGVRLMLVTSFHFACGGSGGTVNFCWAQGTSNATATNVITGSTIFGARVA